MQRIVRIVLVLLLVSLFGNVSLMAENGDREWPQLAPELLNENRERVSRQCAMRRPSDEGPIMPPGKEFKPHGMSPAKIANMNNPATGEASTPGNLDSFSAQAIPGSRTRSFMSEHRVAERSLRGTIKRLG